MLKDTENGRTHHADEETLAYIRELEAKVKRLSVPMEPYTTVKIRIKDGSMLGLGKIIDLPLYAGPPAFLIAEAEERGRKEVFLSILARLQGAECCPNCCNEGYWVRYHAGEPEQEQCEFCCTTTTSLFHVKEWLSEMANKD